MKKQVYLDNAATTWPKPFSVGEAMAAFLRDGAANPGRGGHSLSLAAGRSVFACRQQLAALLGVKDASRLVFTANATQALNIALLGVLRPGDHCITTSMEHNAVVRPLHHLAQQGVEVTVVPGTSDGSVETALVAAAIRPNTRLIAMTHASNVCGTLLPIAEIGAVARQAKLLLLVDAAQTAGVFPIDVEQMGIDMLAVPSHKSLLGPPGLGALFVGPRVLHIAPLVYGGTGSFSAEAEMPQVFPDRLEAGTLNTVGIVGLAAGLDYLATRGMPDIYRHESGLIRQLHSGLESIAKVRLYGQSLGAPIVAFNILDMGSTEVAHILDGEFGIATRAGLHCAPLAHQTLGTSKQGVVRVSPGPFSTENDIDLLLEAVLEIARVS
ncbi:MAG: Cysteine desulfurase SufS [Firmicutes bacterium]|nr:Cysteine desulfurase SufS [Bacillota bacterium]